jgi:hypothetical protein
VVERLAGQRDAGRDPARAARLKANILDAPQCE